jgi:hypothetical protein
MNYFNFCKNILDENGMRHFPEPMLHVLLLIFNFYDFNTFFLIFKWFILI